MQPIPFAPIREAVSSGEFGKAQLLWNECAAGLAGELRGGTLSAARLAEVRDLVEWSRAVVLCERAHLLGQLNGLHVASEYAADAPAPVRHLAEVSF